MLFGPPLRLLYQAHRSGQRVGLGVHSERFWVSMVLEKRHVVFAAGIPDLLDDLPPSPRLDPEQLNGVMSHDMEVAIRDGYSAHQVIEAACAGVGRFLAGLVDNAEVSAHIDPHPAPVDGALPLPRSAIALLAEGLPELRPPEEVARRFHPERNHLVVARVPDDSYLIDLDPITLRTLRLVRQPVALGDLAARSGRNQTRRTEHFWRAFDLLHALGLLEILRPDRPQERWVSSDIGGWESGVERPPSRTAASPPLRSPSTRPPPRAAPPAPPREPVSLGRPVARLEEAAPPRETLIPEEPAPRTNQTLVPAPSDTSTADPSATFLFDDLSSLDGGDDGVMEAFSADDLSVEPPPSASGAAFLWDEDEEEDEAASEPAPEAPRDAGASMEFLFDIEEEDEDPDTDPGAGVSFSVEEEADDPSTSLEFVFGEDDGLSEPLGLLPEPPDLPREAPPAPPVHAEPPSDDVFLLFDDEPAADPLDLLGGEPASTSARRPLSLEELGSPERLQEAVDARQRAASRDQAPAGGLMALIGEADPTELVHEEPEIIVEDDEEEDTWAGPLPPVEDDEDSHDPTSDIHTSAERVLDEAAPALGGEVTAVSEDALFEMSALCGELNPLAILHMNLDQLDGMLTLDGVRLAFQRERRRYDPKLYKNAGPEVRDAAHALDEILRASREALRDPAIVAMWVRALRAFAEERPPPDAQQLVAARRHFEEAQALAFQRDWRGASLAVTEALRNWPGQPRVRLLQVFCEVAQRRISPLDGVFNIDSMWLSEPAEQALAQVTAGRLLKASGRGAQAVARFRAALELDPDRDDARRELAAAQQ